MVVRKVVVIGASSELSRSFVELCSRKNISTYLVSRRQKNLKDAENYLEIKDYIDDIEILISTIKDLGNCVVIFFNGALFENRPLRYPSKKEIELTELINYQIPFHLYKKLINESDNIEKFIFISSMAAIKPREKIIYMVKIKESLN